MNFLACDLGGTKVLLGIYKKDLSDNSPKLILKKKYRSSEWDSFDLILEDFLRNECRNFNAPSSACLAVAGPISNNNAKIINLSWDVSGKALKNKFNFKSCELNSSFKGLKSYRMWWTKFLCSRKHTNKKSFAVN